MLIGQIIAAIGLPVLIELIGRVLGTVNHPAAKTASAALGTLKGTMNTGAITPQQIEEANRHTEELASMEYQAFDRSLSEVNQTMRQELSSEDKYVRRMRPTFGYLLAISWAAQMLGLAYIIVFDTNRSTEVMANMESLSAIWAMGLSVLGIYVYKRSEEKKAAPRAVLGDIATQVIKQVVKPPKTQAPPPERIITPAKQPVKKSPIKGRGLNE